MIVQHYDQKKSYDLYTSKRHMIDIGIFSICHKSKNVNSLPTKHVDYKCVWDCGFVDTQDW